MLQRLRKLALHLFSFLSITETHRPGRFFVTAVPARVIEWCWEMKFFFPQMVILVEWAAKLCWYSFSPFLFCLSFCILPLCMQILTCVFMRPDVKFRQFPLQLYTWVLETGLIWNPELTISISEPWRTTTLYASLHMLQCWGGGCALPYLTWTWVASFLVQGFHSFIASTFYNLPSPQSLGFWAELFILLISNCPTFYG